MMNFLSRVEPRAQCTSISLLVDGDNIVLETVLSPLVTTSPALTQYAIDELTDYIHSNITDFEDESSHSYQVIQIPYDLNICYAVIKDQDLIGRILSSFQPMKDKKDFEAISMDAVILSIVLQGSNGGVYHSDGESMLQDLVEQTKTLDVCADNNTADIQRQHLEMMMLSCLMDDNSLITNAQFESKYSQIDDSEAELIQSATMRTLPKRKRFSLAERRKRNEKENIERVSQTAASTSLVSSTATSADIARVLTEQMQVLSIAETNLNLAQYQGKASKRNVNAKLSSERAFTAGRSPVRVIGRKSGRVQHSAVGDMTGFDFIEGASISDSSDATTVTLSTATSSSSGFMPKISGPNRDKVSSKRNTLLRKNKLLSNTLTSSMVGASMERNFNPFKDEQEEEIFSLKAVEEVGYGNGMTSVTEIKKKLPMSFAESPMSPIPSASSLGLFPSQNQSTKLKRVTPAKSIRSEYVPGSRKLFTMLALNEDFTCSYRNSKMQSFSVDGTVQVQLKSESTAFVPFSVLVRDSMGHIEKLEENTELVNDISKELTKNEDWEYKFIVTLPKPDVYFPILKYKCTTKVSPIPLRVQSKVRCTNKKTRVALQISSNPSNTRKLSELTIIMSVPDKVLGGSVSTQPEGGVWSEEDRSVVWSVKELGVGEKFQLQAQFSVVKGFDENSEKLYFPVMVRCHSMATQLSDIHFQCSDVPKGFPADVSMSFANRFRISQREVEY
jgi:hypothetical protein